MEQTATATSRDERSALARMMIQLFDHWGLPTEARLAALGMAPDNRGALTRYRKGDPLAPSRDLLERVGHLLAIHKNLRLLFPQERESAYRWMTLRNRAFDGRTPIEAIEEFGFVGLLMVRTYLDRARGR
jgi:hypothetical protein